MSSNSTRNFIPMQNRYDRVVLLVDMDCFYCQVEEKLDPTLKGQPIAVVQYNAWRGGGIIAVNYPARAQGVTRHMRGEEAKEQCPEIQLVKVPNVREKADLTKYRDAGKEVANVLQRYTQLLERASVDEAYLDITEAVNKRLTDLNQGLFTLEPDKLLNTYAVGYQNIGEYVTNVTNSLLNPEDDDYASINMTEYDEKIINAKRTSDIRLLIGASVASEIRADVKATTGYECSAGIAHNKILAKLTCGINKPNKQTILPLSQTAKYLESLPIRKIKGLGAKFGEEVCERLGVQNFGQMLTFSESELQRKFDEKNGSWLYNICRGIDLEAVTPRFYSKSIGCCKKFPGLNNITGLKTLKHWLQELANEIADRLDKDIFENNRKAKQMVVSYIQDLNGKEVSSSRSAPLSSYEREALAQQSLDIIRTNTKLFLRPGSDGMLNNAIRFLGISVGKFETISNSQNTLEHMFANQTIKSNKQKMEYDGKLDEKLSDKSCSTQSSERNSELVANEEPKSFLLSYLKKGSAKINTKDSNISSSSTDIFETITQTPNKEDVLDCLESTGTKKEVVNESAVEREKCWQEAANSAANVEANSFFMKILKKQMPPTSATDGELKHSNKQTTESVRQKEAALATESDDIPSTSKRKYNDINDDYKATYAEFALPEINRELLETIKCEICGADILKNESAIQTHQDHHFAQQLSQQQREAYRAEIKTKATTTSAPTTQASKKTKTATKATPPKIKADIKQFLRPQNQTQVQTPNVPVESLDTLGLLESTLLIEESDHILCPDCGKSIKQVDMPEHSDYHLAKKLQRELNQLELPTINKTQPTHSQQRKSINTNKSTNGTTVRPINHFFKTKN